jgi:hypothetical protein
VCNRHRAWLSSLTAESDFEAAPPLDPLCLVLEGVTRLHANFVSKATMAAALTSLLVRGRLVPPGEVSGSAPVCIPPATGGRNGLPFFLQTCCLPLLPLSSLLESASTPLAQHDRVGI